MLTYGGQSIFGFAVNFSTLNRPRELQLNSFFGVNGLESIDGGFRGRTTQVTGILVGHDPASLATAEETFRSFQDGAARVLVDSAGSSWNNVVLESFQPQGRIRRRADGICIRAYRARFLHLA